MVSNETLNNLIFFKNKKKFKKKTRDERRKKSHFKKQSSFISKALSIIRPTHKREYEGDDDFDER